MNIFKNFQATWSLLAWKKCQIGCLQQKAIYSLSGCATSTPSTTRWTRSEPYQTTVFHWVSISPLLSYMLPLQGATPNCWILAVVFFSFFPHCMDQSLLKVQLILPLPNGLRSSTSSRSAPKNTLLFFSNLLGPARHEPKCSPEKC
jgi:hypothetical protein